MTNDRQTWLTLLLRWMSGEATRKDEQRLDALAKGDPFLAEALEGYRSLPETNHAAAVTRLKAALRRRQERRRAVGVYLLRAAAVGLVLATAWMVFQQFQNKDMAIAESQTMTQPESAPAPQAVPELRAKSVDSAFAVAEELTKKQDVVVEKKTPRSVPPPPKYEPGNAANEPAPASRQLSVQTETASEKVAAFATDTFQEIAQAADADVAGEVEESSPTLQKSTPLKKEAAAKRTWVAEPEGGFTNLEKHIQKNLRYPTLAIQNDIAGEVTLSFRFKNDGIPTDFKIEKSLGYGCDEEAERLLRTGPRWKFTAGARVSYTIAFKK